LFSVDGNSKAYIVSVVGEWMSIEHRWNGSEWMSIEHRWNGSEWMSIEHRWNGSEWMSIEHRWNDSDGRKKNRSTLRKTCQCHFVHHKSHMDWLGIEPGPSQ
jgi:hypothetical protein